MAVSFAQELWDRDVDEGREDREPKVTTCGCCTHNKLPIALQVRSTRPTVTTAATSAGFPTHGLPEAVCPALPCPALASVPACGCRAVSARQQHFRVGWSALLWQLHS